MEHSLIWIWGLVITKWRLPVFESGVEKVWKDQLDGTNNKRESAMRGKGVRDKRTLLYTIRRRKSNWICYWMRLQCFLLNSMEGLVDGKMEQRTQTIWDAEWFKGERKAEDREVCRADTIWRPAPVAEHWVVILGKYKRISCSSCSYYRNWRVT